MEKNEQGEPTSSEISTLCKDCLECYQSLCDTLSDTTLEQGWQFGYNRDLTLITVQDARIRFKAWAVNIAALHKGHLRSSLDFRLKDASDTRQRTLKILGNLQESLRAG
jgi:hypothetical protein